MSLYKKVEGFVVESFGGNEREIRHLKRTVHWVKELKPDAHEAMLIAAVSHDIERAFSNIVTSNLLKTKDEDFDYSEEEAKNRKIEHASEGARIMQAFLAKEGADKAVVKRVGSLISMHEYGGNPDANMLKDSDSLSFFENNIEFLVNKRAKKIGKTKAIKKVEWMFSRISSEKARKIAEPMYKNALRRLEALEAKPL